MTTVELGQQRPCALCNTPVNRSDFQAGKAKLIQNVLYCVACTQEVERARVETVAFKCSLQQGGLYSCAHCRAPVPIEDIQGGGVVYVDHALACRSCAKDLLKILARGRNKRSGMTGRLPPDPTLKDPPSGSHRRSGRLPPEAALAEPPPTGSFRRSGRLSDEPAPGDAPPTGSFRSGVLPPVALDAPPPTGSFRGGALPPGALDAPPPSGSFRMRPAEAPPAGAPPSGSFRTSQRTSATGRVPSDPPAQAPPPAKTTGRHRRGSTDRLDAQPPPHPSSTGTSRADEPAPPGGQAERKSRRLQPQRVKCAGCDEPIDPSDPKCLLRQGDTFCPACAEGLQDILTKSSEQVANLASFKCSACDAKVSYDDLKNDRAVRSRGELYCAACKNDFGRASIEKEGVRTKRTSAVTVLPTVPCSRCSRPIPPVDVRTGKAKVVGDKMICAPCKEELEVAAERRSRRIQLTCAHCQRRIRSREVEEQKVVHHAGNIYCPRCGNDPEVVLGKSNHGESGEGACGACGAGLVDGVCVPCAAKLAEVKKTSLSATVEFRRLLLPRCDACGNELPAPAVESGEVLVYGKTLCLPCAEKETGGRPTKCRKCGAALGAPGAACATCAEKEKGSRLEAEEWMGLSTDAAVELKCGRCSKKVSAEDLAAGRARSVAGTLECSACVARRPAGGAGRDCPTCDGRLDANAYQRSGRRYCSKCGAVFEQLLSEATILAGDASPCKLCKKPATGGLKLPDGCYCTACRPKAELLVQLLVRERRSKKPKNPGVALPRTLVASLTGVAVVVSTMVILFATQKHSPKAPQVDPSQGPQGPPVRVANSEADAALQRAVKLVSVAPRSFEDAAAMLAGVERELAAIKAEEKLRAMADEVHGRARAARDSFAPALAARVLDESRKAAKQEDFAGAADALRRFPRELAHTPAAAPLPDLLERYEAMAECIRRARDLLRGRPTAAALGGLLASPEAKRCEFAETALGKTVDAELRRLRNAEQALPEMAPPSTDELDALLARADKAEARGDLPAAEETLRKVLAQAPDHVKAQTGLARCALLRGHPGRARREAERAARLAPSAPESVALLAWLDWFDREGHEAGAKRLAGVPGAEATPFGKRLKRALSLGAPTHEGNFVRLYTRGVPEAELKRLAKALEHMAELSARALGLAEDEARLALALVEDRTPLAELGPMGPLYLVAPPTRDDATLVRALAAALAVRSQVAPPWLVVGLPEALSTGAKPGPSAQRLPLAELEAMNATAVAGNPRARQTAIDYAALARTPAGARLVALYAVDRKRSPAKARADLESALRAMGGS